MLVNTLACWLSLGSLAFAGAIPRNADPLPPSRVIVERQATTSTSVPDGQCTNGPRTRNCWSSGFSIATDFDAKAPPAGKTVTYNLEITNTTLNPDGAGDRNVMLINNQFPGPVIRASWGDTLVVNVKNSLADNGTGIHWHGIRQLNSCQHDGVPGVTECPIAPGKSRQYVFKCTQFGTSWYHSHWSAQYSEGTLGTLIIDGPATANYDEDLGTLPITEWYSLPGFTLNEQAQHSQVGPPKPDNILVNGTHVNANGGGSYFTMKVKKGKKYRIRIINTSVDTTFSVSMDKHPFTVITSDFVPIKPIVADQLTLAIGQRYDVVINANQTADNYWFRVSVGTDCGSNDMVGKDIPLGAILQYDGAPDGNPTSTGVTMRTSCNDETNLVPFVPNSVPTDIVPQAEMQLNHHQDATDNFLFRWTIDGSPIIVDWNQPSLQTALEGSSTFGNNSNVYEMPSSNWYFWWIQTTSFIAIPHPIHLHGHDFYILGSGAGTWDGSTAGLNFANPTRRDTATLPGGGYLLLAFPADNPGLWVMHCHIAWHASQGLSVQFLERKTEIKGAIGSTAAFDQGCNEWDDYWFPGNHPYNQTDSGI
ncbi:multicopper oxidase [Trematosphaeria pertusa]|uniref:laccase n=1 Tax=Trematosphaeria pertusa TaxID=390896 RepID=A0A6A6IYV3_9PLEO|nr:multicopper oxidase [Trematosphaeria pertusa]KAF2255604.1 multicopper oxidase [Trematosphaeria pertusa]